MMRAVVVEAVSPATRTAPPPLGRRSWCALAARGAGGVARPGAWSPRSACRWPWARTRCRRPAPVGLAAGREGEGGEGRREDDPDRCAAQRVRHGDWDDSDAGPFPAHVPAGPGAAAPAHRAGPTADRSRARHLGSPHASLQPCRARVVPRRRGARPARPGPPAAVRRDQPGAVDRGDEHPLRAPGQPLLPGAARGRDHRPPHRPGRRDDRGGPRLPAGPGHRHHQPGPPGHRPGRRAHPRGAARRCRGPRPSSSREHAPRVVAVAGITAYRQAFGLPRAVVGRAAASRWREPGCGSCRTRAGSTPTTRSPRWPQAYAEPARAAGVLG